MPTIEVIDETLAKIKEQFANEITNIDNLKDLVGKKVFFRTVTYHMLGKVEKVMGNIIELSTASWIADSGRFMNFIKNGEINEVEPVGQWFININSVTDFGFWKHDLPTEQK